MKNPNGQANGNQTTLHGECPLFHVDHLSNGRLIAMSIFVFAIEFCEIEPHHHDLPLKTD